MTAPTVDLRFTGDAGTRWRVTAQREKDGATVIRVEAGRAALTASVDDMDKLSTALLVAAHLAGEGAEPSP